jgi:hypothetical protein
VVKCSHQTLFLNILFRFSYSKIAEPQQVCTFSLLDYDFHVVIVHGRTLDLPVDVVVCPVTECLFPFGYSDEVYTLMFIIGLN